MLLLGVRVRDQLLPCLSAATAAAVWQCACLVPVGPMLCLWDLGVLAVFSAGWTVSDDVLCGKNAQHNKQQKKQSSDQRRPATKNKLWKSLEKKTKPTAKS